MVRPLLKSLETVKNSSKSAANGTSPPERMKAEVQAKDLSVAHDQTQRKTDTPAQAAAKDLVNREIRKANARLTELNRRYNPIVVKVQQAWQEHGKGLKYIQVGFTMLPGRKLRLDTIHLSPDSNVKPSAAKLVIACVQETLASVEGDPAIDTGLAGESSAGISIGLTTGEIHPFDMKLLPKQ